MGDKLPQIKVNACDLRKALQQTKSSIPFQDMEILLRHYLMAGSKEHQQLSVMATDLDFAAIGVAPAVVPEDFEVAVPGIKLATLGENFPTAEIIMEIDGDDLSVRCVSPDMCNFWGTFRGMPTKDFLKTPDFSKLNPSMVSREEFLDHLKRIAFSINDNPVMTQLLAVHIAAGFIQASNGRVTSSARCSLSGDLVELDIPAGGVQDLIAVLSAATEPNVGISKVAPWLVFEVGHSKFLAKERPFQFPNITKIVDKPTQAVKQILSFDRVRFIEAIKRVKIFADEKTGAVLFTLHKDKILLSAEEVCGHKGHEEVPAAWNGEEGTTFSLNYSYLIDMLPSLQAESVQVKVPKGKSLPVRFDDSDFVVFLMRLQ